MRWSWRFDIPPAWGYLICALVVIPLVTHGVTAISRLQVWTQPLWLVMLVVPFVYVLMRDPGAFNGLTHYIGAENRSVAWPASPVGFGAALTVGIALITQMGEQADYLRFMPEKRRPHAPAAGGSACWWAGRAGWCWAC
jgi:purine-cytosine permease-like protein